MVIIINEAGFGSSVPPFDPQDITWVEQ